MSSTSFDEFCSAWAHKLAPFAGPMKMRQVAASDLKTVWTTCWTVAHSHIASKQRDERSSWKLAVPKVFSLAQVDKRELEAGRFSNLPRLIFGAAREFVERFNLVPRLAFKTPEHIKATDMPLRDAAGALNRPCDDVTFLMRTGFDVLGELAHDIRRSMKIPCGPFGALVIHQRQLDFAFANADEICSVARCSTPGSFAMGTGALLPPMAPRASTPAAGRLVTLPLSVAAITSHNAQSEAPRQLEIPVAVPEPEAASPATPPEMRKLRTSQSQRSGNSDARFFAAKNRKYVVDDELRNLQEQLESRLSRRTPSGSEPQTPHSYHSNSRSISALGYLGTLTGVENYRKASPTKLNGVLEAAVHRQEQAQEEERSLQRRAELDHSQTIEAARAARTKLLVRRNLDVLALESQLAAQVAERRVVETPVSITKVIDTKPFETTTLQSMSLSLSPLEQRRLLRRNAENYKAELDRCSQMTFDKRLRESQLKAEQDQAILQADRASAEEHRLDALRRRSESRLQYTEAWGTQQHLRLPPHCGHD